eukprot:735584-Rhodomonas_salina.1
MAGTAIAQRRSMTDGANSQVRSCADVLVLIWRVWNLEGRACTTAGRSTSSTSGRSTTSRCTRSSRGRTKASGRAVWQSTASRWTATTRLTWPTSRSTWGSRFRRAFCRRLRCLSE